MRAVFLRGPAAWPTDPRIMAVVRAALQELNRGLNRWETIKDLRILPRDLSVDDGELTPSLKIKRKVVERNYAHLLAEMHPEG